ncbi:MAG: hypothetical protein GTO45_34015, partial [Candidatus Aminicenantes bacterium]|nr:hypothetical protein [Candidatus Aminicenantes bacterium]NIM83726.1 hypothetical protein [Candidatus Aminicenantes bacterium]NIN23151.1 hypothetical protein [Candidatus Aminicenantes bacterium]NIN46878.1 hypothetical protein [Candidatus Aminicenantes bacterium]NIN89800.1 hypothetical protein [Candidatus Aminicenantes bacterium]
MKRVFITILMLLLISFSCFGLLPGSSPVKKVFPRWTSYTNSSYITDLVLDKNILWAAGGGVTKFDLTAGTRIKYLKEHGLASNNVQKMVLLDKILWITTANGITCFNIKKNTRKSFYKSDGLPDDAVTAVAVDKTGNRIWFGTWEGHLFNINSAKKKWGLLKAGIKIPDAIITSLVVNPVNGS